jgi:hypothetical protein
MIYSWFEHMATKTFAFNFTAWPQLKFTFDKVAPTARIGNRPFKRRRPLWDVDGGASKGKKKRRLRLNLITSRLSRPFSVPATNIINKGISKIAIWAKRRRLDKDVLRKAAILNRVRTRLDAAKATAARDQEETTRQVFGLRQVLVQKPRCYDALLPPSPLGLSNYDALDLEDEMSGHNEDEDGEDAGPTIYSDFNVMKPPTDADGDEYEYLDGLDGIPQKPPEERPPPPPDERMVEMYKERERQRELCFVHFVT